MIARLAAAGFVLAAAGAAVAPAPREAALELPVPVIAQAPEHCGPVALAMVLRFYGAPDSGLAWAERAYSPALRGALISDLARVAERAGYAAHVASLTEDSLRVLLADSLPPILHYRTGPGPVARGHYGVLTGWDPARGEYVVNDGGPKAARFRRDDLMKRWRAADSLALIVKRRSP